MLPFGGSRVTDRSSTSVACVEKENFADGEAKNARALAGREDCRTAARSGLSLDSIYLTLATHIANKK